eukprot:1191224-Prorocentrum_minimum.AAC.3
MANRETNPTRIRRMSMRSGEARSRDTGSEFRPIGRRKRGYIPVLRWGREARRVSLRIAPSSPCRNSAPSCRPLRGVRSFSNQSSALTNFETAYVAARCSASAPTPSSRGRRCTAPATRTPPCTAPPTGK